MAKAVALAGVASISMLSVAVRINGTVVLGEGGALVTYKPPRVSKLETRFVANDLIIAGRAADSDEGGYLVFVASDEVDVIEFADINSVEVGDNGFAVLEDGDGDEFFVNMSNSLTQVAITSERFDADGKPAAAKAKEEAPAKKPAAAAKKPAAKEEAEPAKKPASKKPAAKDEAKAPAKKTGGKKPAAADAGDGW